LIAIIAKEAVVHRVLAPKLVLTVGDKVR